MRLDHLPRAGSPFGRRGFLKISAATGAALTAGSSVLMSGCSAHYLRLLPPNVAPLTLTPKELAVLSAFVARVLPDESGHLTVRDARLAERIDKELFFHSTKYQADVKDALWLLEYGGWMHLSPTRFSARDSEDQDAYLRRMSTGGSLERQAFSGLKLLAVFFYYCDDRTWDSVHYEGPHVKIPAPPPADSALITKLEWTK